jgi:acyl-CoA thioesterase FadM
LTGFVSRWTVLEEHPVDGRDVDPAGSLHEQVVRRWADDAVSAYLTRCKVLEEMRQRSGLVMRRYLRPPSGPLTGRPAAVVVTASATEVMPTSFTIALRLRPLGGMHEDAVGASCVIHLEDDAGKKVPLAREIRDELISLEHSARHFN